ncbi:biotin-dependent carboxyltransferase family protein [Rhodococcus sp. IEGM 1381]|uniref:5-oxoprolinase subunit C family protein n=1 Tax=Rhodococcus sp. IEGM 1381 TaxID=3047085 RepID=UPI0024B80427|nr:biotin-dependent carboxyltransferase family protein [Rhodococcus sp. IEGM 1381]MDI9897448.1 biotin-dependent carboxyltransferase family protein [Rhodococcus sp. IEGM 1381]
MTLTETVSRVDPLSSMQPLASRVRICDPGASTTIQDGGRAGYAHLGITASGPVDRAAAHLANRLTGNAEDAAVFENLFGGLTLDLTESRYVAVTGAPVEVRVDGRVVREPERVFLRAGQRLSVGRPTAGIRVYVSVAGGVRAEKTFGSASTDALSGLGPRPLTAGDEFELSAATDEVPDVPLELARSRYPNGTVDLRFRWGPRDSLFDLKDRQSLMSTRWTVGSNSNRVGVRLAGPPLAIGSVDLRSEGMALGAIQVPPSGEPIIFLADHPVTGGYPVIGVVTEDDLDLLGQAAVGSSVRFSELYDKFP